MNRCSKIRDGSPTKGDFHMGTGPGIGDFATVQPTAWPVLYAVSVGRKAVRVKSLAHHALRIYTSHAAGVTPFDKSPPPKRPPPAAESKRLAHYA